MSGQNRADAAAAKRAREDAERKEWLRKVVDQAPPFTPEQAERLALLWRPGVIAMWEAKRRNSSHEEKRPAS